MDQRHKDWNGMNWIRKEKRLAIYLRDGLACCYCGKGIEDDTRLTLDHVKPHKHGGCNSASNLITACVSCNSSRGTRSVKSFVVAVAKYINHGATAKAILNHITRCTRSAVDTASAKNLIQRRGGFTKALSYANQ